MGGYVFKIVFFFQDYWCDSRYSILFWKTALWKVILEEASNPFSSFHFPYMKFFVLFFFSESSYSRRCSKLIFSETTGMIETINSWFNCPPNVESAKELRCPVSCFSRGKIHNLRLRCFFSHWMPVGLQSSSALSKPRDRELFEDTRWSRFMLFWEDPGIFLPIFWDSKFFLFSSSKRLWRLTMDCYIEIFTRLFFRPWAIGRWIAFDIQKDQPNLIIYPFFSNGQFFQS